MLGWVVQFTVVTVDTKFKNEDFMCVVVVHANLVSVDFNDVKSQVSVNVTTGLFCSDTKYMTS